MKHRKFSSAILCGYEKVGGKQHVGGYCRGDPEKPAAVCVLGARNLCRTGSATVEEGEAQSNAECDRFKRAWGFLPQHLNDGMYGADRLPWEHIYGMARAAGL